MALSTLTGGHLKSVTDFHLASNFCTNWFRQLPSVIDLGEKWGLKWAALGDLPPESTLTQ